MLAQYRNDTLLAGGTGFSGTLFKNKETGELTLSFRSTEFVDDAVRDSKATNDLEVRQLGWALGQISEMEDWYAQLRADPDLLGGGKTFNVTGYSLGGHLATAFNLLRQEEAAAGESEGGNPIIATYTFNGAGVGDLADGVRLTDVLTNFRQYRDEASFFTSDVWTALSVPEQNQLRSTAQGRVDAINEEEVRVANLSNITRAFGIAAPGGAQTQLQYQIAAILAGLDTIASSLFPGLDVNSVPTTPKYAEQFGKTRIANLTEIVGQDGGKLAASWVSNSGIHYGTRQEIYIEDQPLKRGTYSFIKDQGSLVADNAKNDFGDTHSLVLLQDSLSLMAAMEELDENLSIDAAARIYAAMSSTKAATVFPQQGKAEGDTLERTLDAFYDLVAGAGVKPHLDYQSVLEGNTWFLDSVRLPFYDKLNDLTEKVDAISGGGSAEFAIQLLTDQRAAELISVASLDDLDGEAYRYALQALNAFAVLTNTSALYDQHNTKGELTLFDAQTDVGLTQGWIRARADLLEALLRYNTQNGGFAANSTKRYVDQATHTALGSQLFVERIIFGADASDAVVGGGIEDQLFGGEGRDVLNGLGGDDYLEGDAGDDSLEGGFGNDTLYGGAGNDRLEGGPGDDQLYGGTGNDQLYGNTGDDLIEGGKGNDVLDGGRGFDTYIWNAGTGTNAGDGFDTLIDYREGGSKRGAILYNGTDLTGDKTIVDANNPKLFTDSNGLRYFLVGNALASSTLIIYKPAAVSPTETGEIKIQDFKNGDLGINLLIPAPVEKAEVDGDNTPNFLGSLVAAFIKYFGFGGNDTILVGGNQSEGHGGDGPDILHNDDGDQYLYGDAGDDTLIASGGNDELYGGADNDFLQGGDDDDYLSGGDGDDLLFGGAGADVLSGGDGNDVLFGGGNLIPGSRFFHPHGEVIDLQSIDTEADPSTPPIRWAVSHTTEANGTTTYFLDGVDIQSQSGSDQGDVLDGGAGNDLLFAGGGGSSLLLGGAGDDLLVGNAEADTLFGGSGNDRLYGDTFFSDPSGTASYDASRYGNDFLDGEAGDDLLYGQGGNDTLYGGDGDDQLQGDDTDLDPAYHGNDYLDGGAGNDRLFGQGGSDILYGGEGDDYLDGDDTRLDESAHGDDFLDGGAGNDTLYGGGGNDILYGGDGDDTLAGDYAGLVPLTREGNDYLDGGDGSDSLSGDGGNDQLFGGAGSDSLYGGAGDDALTGGTGNDYLAGGAGDDRYFFALGDGNDTLEDHEGTDQIEFGEGIAPAAVSAYEAEDTPGYVIVKYSATDTIAIKNGIAALAGVTYADGSYETWQAFIARTLEAARDVNGTAGNDVAFGGRGADRLFGEAGDDRLYGGAGDDQLFGGDGDDQLAGEAGNDILDGGAGADTLFGGLGDDTYVFRAGDGHDTIDDPFGYNRVAFGAGIDVSTITAYLGTDQNGDTYLVTRSADGDEVGVKQTITGGIRTYSFADGEILDAEAIDKLTYLSTTELLGTAGADTLIGTAGPDVILGRGGDDIIAGGAGDDYISGGAGNDVLRGNSGNDLIAGNAGDDLLIGGLGLDTFIFRPGDGHDLIRKEPVLAGGGLGLINDPVPDVIRLGFNPGETTVTNGSSLIFSFTTGDTLTVESGLTSLYGSVAVGRVDFKDGTVWDLSTLKAHTLLGTAGDDTLVGFDTDDVLEGYGGNDSLSGGNGDDILRGGDGVDTLDGGAGNDRLEGGAGADTLYGRAGDDILDGGTGNDTLNGGTGSDLYLVTPGTGNKLIVEAGADAGTDTLRLAGAWTADNLQFYGSGGNLVIQFPDASTVEIVSWLSGYNVGQPTIEAFESDAGPIALADIYAAYLRDLSVVRTLRGSEGADLLLGFDSPEILFGLGGDDTLYGFGGDDTLEGGAGNDRLFGGQGSDTYLIAANEGHDLITESAADAGFDTVRLTGTWTTDNLRFYKTGDNLVIRLAGSDVEIAGWFSSHQAGQPVIERFESDAGVIGEEAIYAAYLRDRQIIGTDGDDTLTSNGFESVFIGGRGNDTLVGGTEPNTYYFAAGDGVDTLIDPGTDTVIEFGPGIRSADIRLVANANDGQTGLRIAYTANDAVIIANQSLSTVEGAIAAFRFADGSVLSFDELVVAADGFSQQGQAGNDYLRGGYRPDNLFGGPGNDVLIGGYGNDLLVGGPGDDFLDAQDAGGDRFIAIAIQNYGRTADTDLFYFNAGDGHDIINYEYAVAGGGYDAIIFGAGIKPSDVSITLVSAEQKTGYSYYLLEGLGFTDYADTLAPANRNFWQEIAPLFYQQWLSTGARATPFDYTRFTFEIDYTDTDSIRVSFDANGYFATADGAALTAATTNYWNSSDGLSGSLHYNYLIDDVLPIKRMFFNDGLALSQADLSSLAGRYYSAINGVANSGTVPAYLPGLYAPPLQTRLFDLPISNNYASNGSSGGSAFIDDSVALHQLSDFVHEPIPGRSYIGTEGDDVLKGSQVNDYLFGLGGNDLLRGRGGDDYLDGGDGDDVLDGGPGNDSLVESAGNDTYLFGRGAGHDLLFGTDTTPGNKDRVQLTAGVAPGDLALSRNQDDLILTIGDTGDTLTLSQWFLDDAHKIEEIAFVDGTLWDVAAIEARVSLSQDDILYGDDGDNLIHGFAGDDLIFGLGGNDTLYGDEGNDYLDGGDGDDYLDGGPGDDLLIGGHGNDTYVFGRGAGNEALFDDDDTPGNRDRILMTSDVRPEDLLLYRARQSLIVRIIDTGEELTLSQWFSDDAHKVEEIRFGDGTIWNIAAMAADYLPLPATDGDDTLFTDPGGGTIDGLGGNDVIYGNTGIDVLLGNDGDDLLEGFEGNDTLDGGPGDDLLLGDDGDDTLIGGPGTDRLLGGEGSDTYRFALGDGVDFIYESLEASGTDVIRFGPGITPDMLTLDLGSLLIHVGSSGDAIHIQNYDPIDNPFGVAIEEFRFDDGVVLSARDLLARGFDLSGTDGDDEVRGTALQDRIQGHSGNDQLFGFAGDDTLDGGAGNDQIDGGTGSNVLIGGSGSDTYFVRDHATNLIRDTAAAGDVNTLVLELVAPSEVRVSRAGNDLLIDTPANSDRVTIADWYATAARPLDTVRFNDGTEWSAATLDSMVGDANHSPVLTHPLSDASTLEDAAYSFVLPADTFTDPDAGDTLTFTARRTDGSTLPAWLIFDAATRTFTGTPANAEVGTLSLRLTATDSGGLSAEGSFDLTVVNTNDAPMLALAIADQAALQDAAFSFTLPANTFTDEDAGDTLSYSATLADGTALPAWLAFDATTLTLSGTPGNDAVGTFAVRLSATDSANAAALTVFNLVVANVNDAPTLANPFGEQAATQDERFSFVLPAGTFADIDMGDTLSYGAVLSDGSALPAWLAFDATTHTFSGTPANDDVGSVSVRVIATDSAGATATDVFSITVANVNDAPTVTASLADQSLDEDAAFAFSLPEGLFADVDVGDTLTIAATRSDDTALPEWLTFDAATRRFAGSPANEDVGTLAVQLTATDRAGAAATTRFMLTVVNVNDAPTVLHPFADQTAVAGSPFSFQVAADTFSDSDLGDTLSYSAGLSDGSALPSWLAFDAATRTFTGAPQADAAGVLGLRVTATDSGGLTASDVFDLAIQALPTGLTLIGTPQNDRLTGGPGNDTLDGRASADLLEGLGGDDTFLYAADGLWGAGFIALNVGSPGYLGTNHSVSLLGKHRSFDVFVGGEGSDTLIATAGDDALFLDDQYSPFYANIPRARLDGIERIEAGAGNDVIDLTSQRYAYGDVTLDGGDGNDVLWASSGNDVLLGGSGNDELYGGAGNDLLDGGSGADTMAGGPGDDAYYVDDSGDIVIELANAGTDRVVSTISYTLTANVEELVLAGAALNGTGNALANVITGNRLANVLNGGAGADTLIGGDGDDTYIVDHAGDVVVEQNGEGFDTIKSSVSRTISAHVERLILTGSSAISATGDDADNVLIGNAGPNTLNGGAGNDLLDGGAGNDGLVGGAGNDVLQGMAGNDKLYDTEGNNLFMGGAGTDFMTGGSGEEIFIGGAGNDSITTGSGTDLIVFRRGDGQDTVNTGAGGHDELSLGGGIRASDLSLKKSGTSLVLGVGDGEQLTFTNWYGANANPGVSLLEIIVAANADFDAAAADALANRQVARFDFQALVSRFDQSTAASWSMMHALLDTHLAGSDSEALGGNLAYDYGLSGSLAGVSFEAAQSILAAGTGSQALQPAAALREGLVKLG